MQNNTDIISQYGCNGNTNGHHDDPMYGTISHVYVYIDRIDINFMDI